MKHGLSFSTNKGRGSEGHIPTVHYLTPVVAWGNKCLLFFANEETVMLRIQYSRHNTTVSAYIYLRRRSCRRVEPILRPPPSNPHVPSHLAEAYLSSVVFHPE